jgi:hypothetical protein
MANEITQKELRSFREQGVVIFDPRKPLGLGLIILYKNCASNILKSIERSFMMSGETLEDYFRHHNLDETRRNYLENIKEGKQVDKEIEEHFKNGNVQQHSQIVEDR